MSEQVFRFSSSTEHIFPKHSRRSFALDLAPLCNLHLSTNFLLLWFNGFISLQLFIIKATEFGRHFLFGGLEVSLVLDLFEILLLFSSHWQLISIRKQKGTKFEKF